MFFSDHILSHSYCVNTLIANDRVLHQLGCSLTLWQAERHFCHLRLTVTATTLSFGYSLFTSLDSIGSAVDKRPIGYAIATSECATEY